MLSQVAFVSIPVLDLDRAKAFWAEAFGMRVFVDRTFDDPPMRWVMMEIPGADTRLHLDPVGVIGAGHPVPLIAQDVESAVETLRDLGVTILLDPGPAEWDPEVTRAMILDSEGNRVVLSSR